MPVFVIRMLLGSLLLVPMFVSKTSAESPVVPLSQKPRVMNNFVQVEPYLMASGDVAGIGDPSVR